MRATFGALDDLFGSSALIEMGQRDKMVERNKKLKALVLFAGLCLTGCSYQLEPVATEPDVVGTRIAQAAEKAAKALDTISSIEQAREPNMPAPQDYTGAPPALKQAVTVKWTGPIEQILKAFADRVGMRFEVAGNSSGVPILVSLDVYQKPLVEVLYDLGLQAGRRAEVNVNSTNNSIEIHYAPVDRI